MIGKLLGVGLVALPAIGFVTYKWVQSNLGETTDTFFSTQMDEEALDMHNKIKEMCKNIKEEKNGAQLANQEISCSEETIKNFYKEKCIKTGIDYPRTENSVHKFAGMEETLTQCISAKQTEVSVTRT